MKPYINHTPTSCITPTNNAHTLSNTHASALLHSLSGCSPLLLGKLSLWFCTSTKVCVYCSTITNIGKSHRIIHKSALSSPSHLIHPSIIYLLPDASVRVQPAQWPAVWYVPLQTWTQLVAPAQPPLCFFKTLTRIQMFFIFPYCEINPISC